MLLDVAHLTSFLFVAAVPSSLERRCQVLEADRAGWASSEDWTGRPRASESWAIRVCGCTGVARVRRLQPWEGGVLLGGLFAMLAGHGDGCPIVYGMICMLDGTSCAAMEGAPVKSSCAVSKAESESGQSIHSVVQ